MDRRRQQRRCARRREGPGRREAAPGPVGRAARRVRQPQGRGRVGGDGSPEGAGHRSDAAAQRQ
uniref:Uncharacterized protein n=1 Tax=Arundo donax TaxID=35708 RepID=A0A0A9BTR3_ARUDO